MPPFQSLLHIERSAIIAQIEQTYMPPFQNLLYTIYSADTADIHASFSKSAAYIALRQNSLYILTFENSQENSQNIQSRLAKEEGGASGLKERECKSENSENSPENSQNIQSRLAKEEGGLCASCLLPC